MTPGALVMDAVILLMGASFAVALLLTFVFPGGHGRRQRGRVDDVVRTRLLAQTPPDGVRRIALPDETSDCTTCGGSGFLGGCQECHRVPLMEAQRIGGEDW